MFSPPPLHPARPHLVAPVRVDPRGEAGPTHRQARGRGWRRTSHGLYVPSFADADLVEQRIVEMAALLRPGGAVTGWAALRWCGGRWFEGTTAAGEPLPVPLVAAHHLEPQRGASVSQEFLRPGEVVLVDGVPVTIPVRSVCFVARHALSLDEAVVALDMAAYSDLVSVAEAAAYAVSLQTWTGVPQLRAAIRHADENSWSPAEVDMRRVWERAVRARPLCNVPVFDLAGRHVATPDLLDPVEGVVGEYDSSLHLVGSQRTKDVRREGELRALGLEHVVMLGSDRIDDHRSFVARLGAAYSRARQRPSAPRCWTTEAPPWWVDTTTVEARRALGPGARRRLLRYRRAG